MARNVEIGLCQFSSSELPHGDFRLAGTASALFSWAAINAASDYENGAGLRGSWSPNAPKRPTRTLSQKSTSAITAREVEETPVEKR